MSISKELRIDLFQHRIKAQRQSKIFDHLVHDTSGLCGVDCETMHEMFGRRLEESTFAMGDGVAIFDVQSPLIVRNVIVISTFDRPVDFDSLGKVSVDIMASVLSPKVIGARHLQKLAEISRILKSDDLCSALRDACDEDALRVLFMPTQDWMVAA